MKKVQNPKILIFSGILLLLSLALCGFDFIHSNIKYQENISVESYLMHEGQVGQLFENKIKTQLTNKNLSLGGQLYLVIALKNTGGQASWGTLSVSIEDKGSIKTNIGHLSPNMEDEVYYIQPLVGWFLYKNDIKPQLKSEWVKLYSK